MIDIQTARFSWDCSSALCDRKSKFSIGDILYVRETWAKNAYGGFFYKSDGKCEVFSWHPSIHMPKEAARIFLRVTDIQAERLWDIDHATKIAAEGIDIGEHCRQCIENYGYPCCTDANEEGGSECGLLNERF